MGVHTLAGKARGIFRWRSGKGAPETGGQGEQGQQDEGTRRGPAAAPAQRRREQGRQRGEEQKRALVPAPQIGELQIPGKVRRAIEPDMAQGEIVEQQMDRQCGRRRQQQGEGEASRGGALFCAKYTRDSQKGGRCYRNPPGDRPRKIEQRAEKCRKHPPPTRHELHAGKHPRLTPWFLPPRPVPRPWPRASCISGSCRSPSSGSHRRI